MVNPKMKKTLDLTLEYLRRVYSFCYYCVTENDSIHELTRPCGAGHHRRATPPDDWRMDQKSGLMSLLVVVPGLYLFSCVDAVLD